MENLVHGLNLKCTIKEW